jgi:hypothetical protein
VSRRVNDRILSSTLISQIPLGNASHEAPLRSKSPSTDSLLPGRLLPAIPEKETRPVELRGKWSCWADEDEVGRGVLLDCWLTGDFDEDDSGGITDGR